MQITQFIRAQVRRDERAPQFVVGGALSAGDGDAANPLVRLEVRREEDELQTGAADGAIAGGVPGTSSNTARAVIASDRSRLGVRCSPTVGPP